MERFNQDVRCLPRFVTDSVFDTCGIQFPYNLNDLPILPTGHQKQGEQQGRQERLHHSCYAQDRDFGIP